MFRFPTSNVTLPSAAAAGSRSDVPCTCKLAARSCSWAHCTGRQRLLRKQVVQAYTKVGAAEWSASRTIRQHTPLQAKRCLRCSAPCCNCVGAVQHPMLRKASQQWQAAARVSLNAERVAHGDHTLRDTCTSMQQRCTRWNSVQLAEVRL